jgi:hypothetical protein
MIRILGILLVVILAGIALLHFYWAAGGGFGGGSAVPSVGGRRAFEPSTFATVMVGLAFVAAVPVVLGRLGYWGGSLPAWLFRMGTAGIGVIFLARAVGDFRLIGFFKRASESSFASWDSWVYSPLCVAIAVIAFVVIFRSVD